MKVYIAAAALLASVVAAQNRDPQPHYLLGLLNYPNSFIPDELAGHTSGTAIPVGDEMWVSAPNVPFADVPGVGFSDMEFAKDAEGNVVVGEFFCLSDNGFGSSDNSVDYPLNIQRLSIQKPFTYRHAETTFDKYTPVTNLGTALIHDPNNLIKWENGADIQVVYAVPDATWTDYQEKRVLTGRDFDPEGLAVINENCAVLGDEMMPAIFQLNPSSGEVLSNFVRTPDIDSNGNLLTDKFLSTRSDKVHCTIEALEANTCSSVESSVVDGSDYRKHDKSGGYEGFSMLGDGTIAAFLEKNSGDTSLSDEPGVRVYHVQPGDCSSGSAPKFAKFFGFYPFEIGAGNIADVSTIPGSSRYVAVIERNGFPEGHMWPGAGNPANRLCVVDLLDVDENKVMHNKKCIMNYHDIDDPWDADGNGIFKYGHTQVTNEALVIVDDYCIIAGTDTNYPWTNQFGIDETVEYYQEVSDARFMVVCFAEPLFNLEHPFLKHFGVATHSLEVKPDGTTVSSNGEVATENVPAASPTSPSSRALMHESTDYWHMSTLVVGGLVLAVGGVMLAA